MKINPIYSHPEAADFIQKGKDPSSIEAEILTAVIELGRNLGTVEKQIRPALIKQIKNKGLRFHEAGLPIAALITELVVAAWEGAPDNIWRTDEKRKPANKI